MEKIFELLRIVMRLISAGKTNNEGGTCITYAPNKIGDDEFLACEYIPY